MRYWCRQRILVVTLLILVLRLTFFSVAWVTCDIEQGSEFRATGFRGDAGWYARIALNGYPEISDPSDLGYSDGPDVKQSEWAFFPLYPLVVRGVVRMLGCDIGMAMFLLSIALGIASIHLFSLFAECELGPKAALFSTLGLLLFPTGLYFHVYYSEALFLCLFALAFLGIKKDRSWLVMIATSLLVLVRPNGLLMLLPLGLYSCEQVSGRISALWWIQSNIRKQLLSFGPAVIVFAAYCAYQYEHTGEAFAFSLAQAGWGRTFTMPYNAFFRSGDFGTQFESWSTLVLILVLFLLRRHFTLSQGTLLVISVFVPLFSGAVDSMTRFVILMVPLFLLYGAWLERSKVRWWVLGLSAVLQIGWWIWWLGGEPIAA